MAAIESGNRPCVAALLAANADADAAVCGTSPLHAAVWNANPELVRQLIVAKAKLEAKETNGATPLFIAVNNRKVPAVTRLLVDAGADVNAIGPGGKIVWQNSEGSEVHKLLKAKGARTWPDGARSMRAAGARGTPLCAPATAAHRRPNRSEAER